MPWPSVTLLRTQTDDRLVVLAAGGHERAFEAIVERYRRSLLRHARRYLPEARAEDALQQALLSAWTALRRGDEVRDLRPWLHRIVHNTALNALRSSGYDYDELRETLEGSGGPAELAERRMVVRGTLAGLAALPDRQRDALLQIAVEGRTQDEVAAELGLTQNAVRQLVHRARTALRAAATVVMPLPFATWLATAGADRGDFAMRLGELVAGAGGTATLAKAGTVAVLAGGAVAGPAVVHDASDRAQSAAPAAGSARADSGRGARDTPRDEPVRIAAPAPTAAGGGSADGDGGQSGQRDDGDAQRDRGDGSSGSGEGGSGSGHRDQPGSHGRGDDHSSRGNRDDDASRAGDDDDDERSSGSHRGDHDDHSPSSRRSERRRSGDDDESDHGDDDPPAAQGDDDDPQPSPSGGGSSGSSEHGDDEEAVPTPAPAASAAPSATPESDESDGDEDSSGPGSPDD